MGNQHAVATSLQSTSSDSSLPPRQKRCSIDFPLRLHSTSSSDSESNNNQKSVHIPNTYDSSIILQSANQKALPVRVRKISRAVSASRIHRRRNHTVFSVFGSKSQSMNDDTKGAICEQWHTILALYDGDISRVGVAVYQRIFDAEPQLREVFGIPSFVTDLSEYEPFQRSGKLFMSVVDLCVRNIYALDAEMGPVLVMYGRRHYHQQSRGFHLRYMPIFTQCMKEFVSDCLNEKQKTSDSEDGWSLLFDYIAAKIVDGVSLECHRTYSLRRKSAM